MNTDRYKATCCRSLPLDRCTQTDEERMHNTQDNTLAQAYVPSQTWETPKTADMSLRCGTAFAALVRPYRQGSRLGVEAK